MRPLFVVDRDRQKLKITKGDIAKLRDEELTFSALLSSGKVRGRDRRHSSGLLLQRHERPGRQAGSR